MHRHLAGITRHYDIVGASLHMLVGCSNVAKFSVCDHQEHTAMLYGKLCLVCEAI